MERSFDDLLASRFGAEQLGEIRRGAAAELLTQRETLVGRIREIESRRDAELNDLRPKLSAAEKRATKASGEFLAAANSKNALLRKRASVGEAAGNDIGKLQRELRATAPTEIDAFVGELDRMREVLCAGNVQTELRETERVGDRGPIVEVLSTRPSVDARLVAIQEAAKAAEAMRLLPTVDVSAALSEIRGALPAGELQLVATGEVFERGQTF